MFIYFYFSRILSGFLTSDLAESPTVQVVVDALDPLRPLSIIPIQTTKVTCDPRHDVTSLRVLRPGSNLSVGLEELNLASNTIKILTCAKNGKRQARLRMDTMVTKTKVFFTLMDFRNSRGCTTHRHLATERQTVRAMVMTVEILMAYTVTIPRNLGSTGKKNSDVD